MLKTFRQQPWQKTQLWGLYKTQYGSDGYLRRWVIIPFPTKLDRSIGFDEGTIRDEASGILNKAIAHLRVLTTRGRFDLTGAAGEALEEFRTQNDPVRTWLKDESSVRVGLPNTRISRQVAYDSYRWWCIEQGFKISSSDKLYKALRREGFTEQSSNGSRFFLGLCRASDIVGGGSMAWQM